MDEQVRKRLVHTHARAALIELAQGDIPLLERTRARLASIPDPRPMGWKDLNPRAIAPILAEEAGIDVHALQNRVRIDVWGDLCVFPDVDPQATEELFDDAIKFMVASTATE